MSRKLIYLFSFALVLALAGDVSASGPFQQDPGPDGIVSIEAENFDENTPQGAHTWDFITSPAGFSGTGAMRAMPDSGVNPNPGEYTSNSPRLDFEVKFVKTGTHYVWVRYMMTGGGDNSGHVGINGDGTTSDRINGPAPVNQWNWNNDRMAPYRGDIAQITVDSAGVHTINVWMREGGWRFDKLILTTDANYTPTGAGPPESVRSIPPKTAYNPDPSDGAEFVDLNVEFNWTAGLGAGLHTVYFGDNLDDVSNAAGGLQQGKTTYTPGLLEFAKTYYWRVDEFGVGRGGETHKGDIWSFTTQGAVGSPEPANGAVDVKQTPVLSWNPGVLAASHEVYFGTDEEAVKNATTTSPEYQGTRALGDEILNPGKLTFDTTYYWRVDEVNNTNPDSPWVGNLWSFTTADFIVVDDFEDYDIGNNEIWWAWKDGSGYASHPTEPPYAGNGTGSMVGDESTGSYTEEIRVHGGSQAMPLFFDNSVLNKLKYSEVEMTLTYPRDWTENGVSILSIWFRGDSANAAEPMYVALNGNAVVYHDNPDATKIYIWMEWRIDLQAFADQGVDLTNVNTIALGFGDRNNPQPGGKGLMLFDDIRLYRP
jgi:hypothetical protein